MKFSLILLLLLAQSSYAVNLSQAVKKLSQNEAWQQSINQVLLKEADVDITQSGALPTLSVRGVYTKQNQTSNSLVGTDQHQVYLNLTQPLFQGLKEFRANKYADLILQAQKEVKAASQRELTYQLIQKYFEILIMQQEISLLRESYNTSKAIEKTLTKRQKIGLSRKSELLSASSQSLKTKSQLEMAKVNLDVLIKNFWRFVGESPNEKEASSFVIPPAKQLNDIQTIYQGHPAIRASQLMLEAGKQYVKVEQSDHFPKLDLSANYYLEQAGTFNQRKWDASVNMNFPLYEGGKTSSEIYKAKLLEKEANFALLEAQRNLQLTLKSIFTKYQGGKERLQTVMASVEMAKKNYDELRRENKLGLITNLEVMTGLTQYIQERRVLNELKLNLLNYEYQLKALAGELQ